MATFTPFMQSTEAQNIISNYLGGGYDTTSTSPFRNPIFDLRTEQEAAGTLDPSALYPNSQIDFSVQEDVTVDPCPPGYQLIDGVCQPIEDFGKSLYDEKQDRDDRDEEERDYFSIEEMKNLGDYELLKYLDDGWLKGDKFSSTIGGNWMPIQFGIPFGKQNQMRRNFIIDELTRRGYNIGADDKGNQQFNVGNAFGLISNAEAANKPAPPIIPALVKSLCLPHQLGCAVAPIGCPACPAASAIAASVVIPDGSLASGTKPSFLPNSSPA